jgi:RNA polymerase sigma-B factor
VHASQNDERELFAQLHAEPSAAKRDAVVRRYLPLARRLAAKYRATSEPMEDLEQVAAIGLLNAIDRFDPSRGSTFTSFAVPTILGELRRYFRDHTWALRVPRDLQELTLALERARDELTATLGRAPTTAELSRHLDTGEEVLLQALEVSLAHRAFPLLDPGDADGEPEREMPSQLDDGYARVEDRNVLAGLVATLSARDAEIVFLRFHADLTQDAIGSLVGMSQMHVSRVLYRSLLRLREAAGPSPDEQRG